MSQAEDDALDKIVRDKDLEQERTSPEDARRREEQYRSDADIPVPDEDGDVDVDMTNQ